MGISSWIRFVSGRRNQRAVAMLVLFVAVIVPREHGTAQQAEGSLQERFDQATELAKTPHGTEAATDQLKSLVAAHRANESLYRKALQQIADQYRQENRDEEGVRYFVDLVIQQDPHTADKTLDDIIQGYQLRRPELFGKVLAEIKQNRQGSPAIALPAASPEMRQAILQRHNKELRSAALAKLREKLAPDSPAGEKVDALATLASVLTAKFDRQPFRLLVLPLLESNSIQVRMLAVSCLGGLEIEAADFKTIARLADDPSPNVRQRVASVLAYSGDGRQAEDVVPALLKLLSDSDQKVIEASLQSTWGQYASPELDDRLIELSREPLFHGNAIYFGLSTLRQKSKAVCERLVEELSDPDWNNSCRAAWGLTFGVPDDARNLVEIGLLRALPEETNKQTREQEFNALAKVASDASRKYLLEILASESETDQAKAAAGGILKQLAQP